MMMKSSKSISLLPILLLFSLSGCKSIPLVQPQENLDEYYIKKYPTLKQNKYVGEASYNGAMLDLENRDLANAWKGFCYAADHSYKNSKEWCEKLTLPFVITKASASNLGYSDFSRFLQVNIKEYYKPYFVDNKFWDLYMGNQNDIDPSRTTKTITKYLDIINSIPQLKDSQFTIKHKPLDGYKGNINSFFFYDRYILSDRNDSLKEFTERALGQEFYIDKSDLEVCSSNYYEFIDASQIFIDAKIFIQDTDNLPDVMKQIKEDSERLYKPCRNLEIKIKEEKIRKEAQKRLEQNLIIQQQLERERTLTKQFKESNQKLLEALENADEILK